MSYIMMRVLASNCGAVLVANCQIGLGRSNSMYSEDCGLILPSPETSLPEMFLGRGDLLPFRTILQILIS